MEYITVKEASDKWNISTRRVCVLCNNGQIPGAVKKSKIWMIPTNANKPEDGRKGKTFHNVNPIALLLNPTFFEYRTDLIPSKEEREFCEIQRLFFEGCFDEAYEKICRLLIQIEDEQQRMVGNMLKVLISADSGKHDFYSAFLKSAYSTSADNNREIFEKLAYSVFMGKDTDICITDFFSTPDYADEMPIISMLFEKKGINQIIKTNSREDISNYEIICREIEEKDSPLICAYCHLYLAVYYHAFSNQKQYDYHMDKAVKILLPRKWYTPLAEYSATLNMDFIRDIDLAAYDRIAAISRIVLMNYLKLGVFQNLYTMPQMDMDNSVQIAMKIVQGKSIKTIADELGISQYKVNKYIDDLCSVAGGVTKKDIKQFVLSNFYV